MLGAQNSLGPVCPVPLTVRGTRIRLPARIKLYYRSRGCLPVRYNSPCKHAPYERLAQLPPLIVDPAPLRWGSSLAEADRVSGALARLRHGQFPRLWSWRLRQPRRRGERLLEAGRIQPGTESSVQRQGNCFNPAGVAFVTGTWNAS